MATLFVLTPESAHFPTANFAPYLPVNARPTLAYDAATDETAYWTVIAPEDITTPLVAVLTCMMQSATTNNVVMAVAVEAVSSGDATDLDAGTSFATVNTSAATAVPATAGYPFQVSITLTNNDSIAAGDYVRISVARDADNASDTAAGDLYLLAVEIRDDR